MANINRGVHRTTAKSINGRRMTQSKGAHIADDSNISADIRAHNAAIDAKRQAKLARKRKV